MNIQYIEKESIMNGDGNRCVVWVSGCEHHCPFCQNPETWDPNGGHLYSHEDQKQIEESLNNPYIRGVTFSGGDPLMPCNREGVKEIITFIKSYYPEKNIWLYTGYSWEEIKDIDFIKDIDVLVDGKFVKKLLDVKYHWAGSTNQRVIDVKETLKMNKIILHE